jgi:hypothetical protein
VNAQYIFAGFDTTTFIEPILSIIIVTSLTKETVYMNVPLLILKEYGLFISSGPDYLLI